MMLAFDLLGKVLIISAGRLLSNYGSGSGRFGFDIDANDRAWI